MNLSAREAVLNAQREATLKNAQLSTMQSAVITAARTPSIRPFSAPKVDQVPTTQNLRIARSAMTDRRPPTFANNSEVANTYRFAEVRANARGEKAALVNQNRDFKSLEKIAEHPDLFDDTECVFNTLDSSSTNKIEVGSIAKAQGKDSTGRERHRLRRSSSNLSLLLRDKEQEEETSKKIMTTQKEENSSLQVENVIPQEEAKSMAKDFIASKESKRLSLMKPCPQSYGLVKCYVKRNRSGANSLFPEYNLFLKDDDILLMSSKKRPNNTSSNYQICMDQSGDVLGKLRSNIMGSEYTIYDSGARRRPGHSNDSWGNEGNNDRTELGAVIYQRIQNNKSEPRKVQVCLNAVDKEGGETTVYRPQTKPEEMLTLLKHKIDTASNNFCVLESKKPQWNEQLQSFVLNFGGRVTMESVKNFQLIQKEGNEEKVVLQFGRVAKDEFTMDFQWPLSPFLAFALSLTSCDSKVGGE